MLMLVCSCTRNNLPQARLNGIEEDLNLEGVQWNVAISILQVGYVLMQIPSNMFLTRTRASIYMPACSGCLPHKAPS